jgi:hypothetical protein
MFGHFDGCVCSYLRGIQKFPASSTAGRLLTIQKRRRDFGSTSTFESIEINVFVSSSRTVVPCDFELVAI